MTQDHYAVLRIHRDASAEEIQRAYRTLALRYHPDRNTAPDAATRMAAINEAYEVLRDPGKRAMYDTQRREKKQRAEAQAAYQRRQQQIKREPDMTWVEGIIGFVKELKKGLKDE